MIVSKYIYQKCFSDGSVGFYSTKTGQCLRLEKEFADLLAVGRTALLPSDLKTKLIQAKMLVEDGTNELKQILDKRRKNSVAFRILTTTACNASCAYCYERGIPSLVMNLSAAEEVADFLAQRLAASEEDILLLEWFGGEPLLNKEAIDRICSWLQERKIRFLSTLTTNGTLLPAEAVDRLVNEWTLTGVQIGLDGAGRTHEQIKGLPEGSFLQIIEKIHRFLEVGCRVRIRMIYTGDAKNKSSLIAFLAKEFPTDKPDVYLFPSYDLGENRLRGVMEEILMLEQQLAEAGFVRLEEQYRFRQRRGRCFAADGGLTIAPDGRLFSCSHAMQDKYCIGTVRDFKEDNEIYRRFTAPDLPSRCLDCVFLPFCMGGCRAAELNMANLFQCHPYSKVMQNLLESMEFERCGIIYVEEDDDPRIAYEKK